MTGALAPALVLQASLLLSAGGPPSPTFEDRVRAATARFRDRQAAILAGYRLIGEDFPGMGEHWVNIGLLFDGRYDPDRPEFLSYVVIDGKPCLTGVAYGLPLLAGELPPEAPAGRSAWHDHAGTIDGETLLPHHHQADHAEHGPRLAMLHAWVWLPNPEGTFAADNWALPYFRLGRTPPPGAPAAAGRALSLVTGGDGHLARAVKAADPLPAERQRLVDDAIARARAEVEGILRGRPGTELAAADAGRLEATWSALWREIAGLLPVEVMDQLRQSAAH